MNKLIAAVLLGLGGVASAAGHTMDVRVSNGMAIYAQTVLISDGQQAQFMGPASGGKSMIFNGMLNADRVVPGQYQIEYQLELSGGQGSQAPFIQFQDSVFLRPRASLVTAECGSWTVELTLDAPGTLGKKRKQAPAPWDDGGLGNYRVTADVARGVVHQRCRIVAQPGSQSNLIDGFPGNGKINHFIFNTTLSAAQAGSVKLQYQLEYSPAGMTSLQLLNQETLPLGRKSQTPGQGYKVSLLAEASALRPAQPKDAPVPAASPQTPPTALDNKAVPLLR